MDKITIRVYPMIVKGVGIEYCVNTRFIGSSRMVQPAVEPVAPFDSSHIGPSLGTMMAHFKNFDAAQQWIENFAGFKAELYQEV